MNERALHCFLFPIKVISHENGSCPEETKSLHLHLAKRGLGGKQGTEQDKDNKMIRNLISFSYPVSVQKINPFK